MTILFAWLFADFISGIVHWYEDRAIIGTSRFKFINGVRADNERHHAMPGYFLKLTWWENINTTAPFVWTAAIISFFLGAPAFLTLVFLFLGVGNLVHRWAHEPKEKLPILVVKLQKIGLLMSRSHHNGHHYVAGIPLPREKAMIRYCVLTNWLNPVLDYFGFFKLLDRAFQSFSLLRLFSYYPKPKPGVKTMGKVEIVAAQKAAIISGQEAAIDGGLNVTYDSAFADGVASVPPPDAGEQAKIDAAVAAAIAPLNAQIAQDASDLQAAKDAAGVALAELQSKLDASAQANADLLAKVSVDEAAVANLQGKAVDIQAAVDALKAIILPAPPVVA